jgi:hypothetical protein
MVKMKEDYRRRYCWVVNGNGKRGDTAEGWNSVLGPSTGTEQ